MPSKVRKVAQVILQVVKNADVESKEKKRKKYRTKMVKYFKTQLKVVIENIVMKYIVSS